MTLWCKTIHCFQALPAKPVQHTKKSVIQGRVSSIQVGFFFPQNKSKETFCTWFDIQSNTSIVIDIRSKIRCSDDIFEVQMC